MSDDDAFDKIISNQPEGDDDSLANIWEAVEHLWPSFYPDTIPTGKGIIIAEFIDVQSGGRDLRFVASPDMQPWDMQGFIRSAQVDADNFSAGAMFAALDDEDDDED